MPEPGPQAPGECVHQMRELSQKECKARNIEHWGMCWHVYECWKCGLIRAVDSGD